MHALPGCIYRDDLHCRGVENSTSNEPWTRSILEPLSSQARKRKPWYLMIVLKSIGGCFLSSQPSFIVFFAVSTKHPGLGFVDWIWYGWYALINLRSWEPIAHVDPVFCWFSGEIDNGAVINKTLVGAFFCCYSPQYHYPLHSQSSVFFD